MEEAFNNLQKDGKNDVENLMKWMKDSKVIDGSKDQEDKARSLFSEVSDAKNVTLEKFKEIVTKLAGELHKNLGDVTKLLADEGPKLLQSAMAGGGLGGAASALKDAFK